MKLKKIEDNIMMATDDGRAFSDGCPFIPVTHEFADQIYLRKMVMPKGTFVQGLFHNHLHIWFLMTGRVAIKNTLNDEIIVHIAPCYTVSKPGSQRNIYAHEDSIFINVHKNPSNTKNVQKIEDEIVSLTKEEYEQKNK